MNNTRFGSASPGSWSLSSIPGCEVVKIGESREKRTLYGMVCGKGPLHVSLTAGAHADEPVGPRAALRLAEEIVSEQTERGRWFASSCTFRIVPHTNPDGDAHNSSWQTNPPDFLDWLRGARREPPGEDVEFNYPGSKDDRALRPENSCTASFLAQSAQPYDLHYSMHSMGVAEGAWFLICREWAEMARKTGLCKRLADIGEASGLGLHDIERNGEKGFSRIDRGVSTTPRSDAMRSHFLERNDPGMAAKFRPSSMEYVQALGGNPLCLVSEVPMFVIRKRLPAAEGEVPAFEEVRRRLPSVREAALAGNDKPALELRQEFQIEPVSWEAHSELQIEFLRLCVEAVLNVKASQATPRWQVLPRWEVDPYGGSGEGE